MDKDGNEVVSDDGEEGEEDLYGDQSDSYDEEEDYKL